VATFIHTLNENNRYNDPLGIGKFAVEG
jgi:hypothetical protein